MSSLSIFDLSQDHIIQSIDRLRLGYRNYFEPMSSNDTNCFIVNKATNRKDGYVKCKVKGSDRKEYYAHHLILLLIPDKRKDLKKVYNSNYQVSYLCHNKRCINPDHLMIETITMNQKRNACNGQKSMHCNHCNHKVSRCTHHPPCILP